MGIHRNAIQDCDISSYHAVALKPLASSEIHECKGRGRWGGESCVRGLAFATCTFRFLMSLAALALHPSRPKDADVASCFQLPYYLLQLQRAPSNTSATIARQGGREIVERSCKVILFPGERHSDHPKRVVFTMAARVRGHAVSTGVCCYR